MISAFSEGLAGMATAVRRLDVAAIRVSDVQRADSLPDGALSATSPASGKPGETANVPNVQIRLVRATYLPLPVSHVPYADQNGRIATPSADPVGELGLMSEVQQSPASIAPAERNVSENVYGLYDAGQH